MNFEDTNGISIKDAWWKFHVKNPKVYQAFCIQVQRALDRGKKKLSSKAIINWIRWEVYLETSDSTPFRINDAYTAWYARLFLHENPQHKDLFELRKIRAEL